MTIKLSMPQTETELRPRITVLGVGGAGGNAVNNMIQSNLEGVDFVVCNTDAQALGQSQAERKLQIGASITQGLGAGTRPEIGRAAAEEAIDEILDHLAGSHMVFITAGMGGGTGTGAAPVIARTTREQGILTVGVVTKPFHFEGTQRMRVAEAGIEELQQFVDTLIVIPNQNLFRVANEKTTFAEAFRMADNVLYSGVRGVTDLMVMPGLINLDFADVRTVMSEMGKAMMGTGEAEGEGRAIAAAEAAISNPLLDDITMKGAKGVLINITGGPDMTLYEVDEAANRIRDEVDSEANIVFGSTFDEAMEGKLRVSVVATGIEADANAAPRPMPLGLTALTPKRTAPPQPAAESPKDDTEAADASTAPETASSDETPPSAEPTAETATEPTSADSASRTAPAESPEQPDNAAPEANRELPLAKAKRPPFIPPRPVMPEERSGEPRPAEPFAAAAMENARSEPPPRKRPSLFERMTGAGRQRNKPAATPTDDDAAKDEPDANQPAQAKPLGGPTQEERFPLSQAEEEMLDIPAFLRRQAN